MIGRSVLCGPDPSLQPSLGPPPPASVALAAAACAACASSLMRPHEGSALELAHAALDVAVEGEGEGPE